MSIDVTIYVEQAGDYDQLKLYRDTTPSGSFSTLVDTVALVPGQVEYRITDPNGTADSWYRWALYDADEGVETAKSEAFRPMGLTLRVLRLEAAMRCGAGWGSVCTANGTQSALIDAALRDSGIDDKFAESTWLYRPNAADKDDRLRRVAHDGFDPSTGKLTPSRDWANAPAEGEAYQVFFLMPPIDWPGQAYSWDRAIRDGLRETWYVDELNLGEGDGAQTLYDLGPHLGYVEREQVRDVFRRRERVVNGETIYEYLDCRKHGRWVDFKENGPGDLRLDIHPPPQPGETVIVVVNRRYEAVYADSDITSCPFELAARAAAWTAYKHLNRVSAGRYERELAYAYQEYLDEYRNSPPRSVIHGI